MFAGLVLTSISTVMLRAALFQRKSRSGWLEELDGIREDALDTPEGGVANVVDGDGIWTDLRDGGEYDDPHEISSLYATDATPDRPVTRQPAKPARKAKPAEAPAARHEPSARDELPPPPPAPALAEPVAQQAPPPPAPPIEVAAEPPAPEPVVDVIDDAWPAAAGGAPTAAQYDDQIWVQPAPHPVRPSEMWHPAELAPAPLGEESFEPIAEERVTSAELVDHGVDPTYAAVPAVPIDDAVHAPLDPRSVSDLESELVAAADVAVTPPAPAASSGLVNGPVGRRVRRDRPAERPKASLPPADTVAASPSAEAAAPAPAEDRSPLPTQPLPPAALPTRSHRMPGLDLPATPSSVLPSGPSSPVAPRTIPATIPATAPAPAPTAGPAPETTPVAEEAAFDPAALVIDEPAPAAVVTPAASVDEPVAAAPAPDTPPGPAPIAIGADGMIDAPGTIVRIGGDRMARAAGAPDGVVVTLERGWCWASPGEGASSALRIELPSGSLTVAPGATALAVVEGDGSIFLVLAAGSAALQREGDTATIERGTIVMIDPSGAAQSDAASDVEIESDPIVAENLALDAEL